MNDALPSSVDALCDDFEAACLDGQRPRIEDFLTRAPPPHRERLLVELVILDLWYRQRAGQLPAAAEYHARFPDDREAIQAAFAYAAARHDGAGGQLRHGAGVSPMSASPNVPPADQGQAPDTVPPEQGVRARSGPLAIGRYRVERLLGRGGFGSVYLAHDDQLCRRVAVKVPHAELAAQPRYAATYLAEARILASLDHPNIVPVHDVGQTEDGLPFVVSKFIEGSDLAHKIQHARPSLGEAVTLTATIAEALHYAHRQGLVHRDVKPGNILIDDSGKPYVADFGLALREEDYGRGSGAVAGTPAYMSPEQARGEAHRVDGRSDLFSLGVVLYELLTGRRPFRGDSLAEVLAQIKSVEPRPLRQVDDAIPKELDRICLKALAKRSADRYATGLDLAEDLRHFLDAAPADSLKSAIVAAPVAPATPTPAEAGRTPTPTPPVKIVPKGLRSFDAGDADFFLELLPGPQDRDGLPESIRFWKTRIEETDPDKTFAVGLMYGPSGCGKSSLVKAGLLPRLAANVIAVYVEATGQDTEARLLKGLRKHCPAIPGDSGLVETVAALRRGQGLPDGNKVVLVLDQFEQFLHARSIEESSDLVEALRQCDGVHVQAVVLVRDDFWMAATRFFRDLEVRLVEGHNSAAVDRFDARHARKVLAVFGRAFGALPDGPRTAEQERFLDQAVAELAEDGKVVSVWLALFADMVKGRPWTPTTLKAVGGVAGVGVVFLEETFSASGAPPEHRLHQRAARAVLKALLPEQGTDIKGHMRSRQELLAASGYAARPEDFADLLRILDSELRLLTPTDPEGQDAEVQETLAAGQYYQLTHDYLVPSLREWLTRKQKQTRRGRAELRLAERAAAWNAKPEARHLPAWWEWLNIRLFARKRDWTAPQRKMMRQTDRYHAFRGLLVAAALLVLLAGGWTFYRETLGRLQAQRLQSHLFLAKTEDVPRIVQDMAPYRRWLDSSLRAALDSAKREHDDAKQLHASLAMLPVDDDQVEYLEKRLLTATPQQVLGIREGLRRHSDSVSQRLWAFLKDRHNAPVERFRAACVLAAYAADDPEWEKVSTDVAAELAARDAWEIGQWAETLRPVRGRLLPPLAELLVDDKRSATPRRTLTKLYASYAADRPEAVPLLAKVFEQKVAPIFGEEVKLRLARRHANAATVLAALGQWDKVLPRLHHGSDSPDPTVRSYVIDRLASGGVEAQEMRGLLNHQDVSVRRALLLALGEIDLDRVAPAEREVLLPRLVDLYRNDPDSGVHGASGWLLRWWKLEKKVKEIDESLASGNVEGERHWYVTKGKQTMVVIPTPEVFWMGAGEERHRRKINRSFAIAAREVTVAEFRLFQKEHRPDQWAPTEDCPVMSVSWYDAAAYCRWLSEQEGIAKDQMCYPSVPEIQAAAKDNKPLPLPKDYLHLKGYRLPTEAEWEYACRAWSERNWAHGDAVELLEKYAWYDRNSGSKSHSVGALRPNDLGLFDMHGNAWEWCHDWYRELKLKKGEIVEDNEDSSKEGSVRVFRGGSWTYRGSDCLAAYRLRGAPSYRRGGLGLRVVAVPSGAK